MNDTKTCKSCQYYDPLTVYEGYCLEPEISGGLDIVDKQFSCSRFCYARTKEESHDKRF